MPKAPTTGKISHKFGEDRRTRKHNGIDYPVEKGTPVKASADGLVVRSTNHEPTERIVLKKQVNNMGEKEKKYFGSYGNVIITYHGRDLKKLKHTYTLYAHLEKRAVLHGMEVRQGDIIGSSGRTGTRQDFYNHKGGYELQFEVLQSKKELKWVSSGPLDFHFASESKRTNPEIFLRSFKALSLQVKNPNNYPLSLEVQRALSLFSDYIGKGKTIIVTGGDRPRDSKTGVGSTSQHAKGTAADIKILGQSHLKTANQALNSGLFDGIGWYEEGYRGPKGEGPHVHVDLRKGQTARWGYDKNGKKHSGYFSK
jgi:hypothetical protein